MRNEKSASKREQRQVYLSVAERKQIQDRKAGLKEKPKDLKPQNLITSSLITSSLITSKPFSKQVNEVRVDKMVSEINE